MTLKLKYAPSEFGAKTIIKPFFLYGVKEITNETEYGKGHFAITIFDRRVFITSGFSYVKNEETGKLYVRNGKWVADEEENKI